MFLLRVLAVVPSGQVAGNPPYSNLYDWVSKAWDEIEHTRGITMLLPANRTEQRWWQELVEPYRDVYEEGQAFPLSVRFLPGRMRFDRPNAVIGPKGDRPPFGCCLVIWSNNADGTADT